jgi:hypothetical protein
VDGAVKLPANGELLDLTIELGADFDPFGCDLLFCCDERGGGLAL